MRIFLSSLFLFLMACNTPSIQKETITLNLNEGWEFLLFADTARWKKATVPGSIQEDLMKHGVLPKLLMNNHENLAKSIETTDWQYRRKFKQSDLVKRNNYSLTFEGLDTYANVFLNDSLLFTANNMFRRWGVQLKYNDFKINNELKIVFHSSTKKAQKEQEKLGYSLPSPNDAGLIKNSSFTRKAPYQFGWDWGPRLVTAGIWKNISLTAWEDYAFNKVRMVQDSIVGEVAYGKLIFSVNSRMNQEVRLSAEIGKNKFSRIDQLNKGKNESILAFQIPKVELWWPNGWGEQKLYKLKAGVSNSAQQGKTIEKKVGFRTIELLQEKDSIGTSFEFVVNGKPLFAKGANYIPQSNFPSSVSKEKYLNLLTDAKTANFNMIRVWGGGIYEQDVFYSLCDSLGLLVWQDFMFACAMYPPNKEFLENVKIEAEEQVKRISSHPSVALWCGNNEVMVAWNNWGWQSEFNYDSTQQKELEAGYNKLFKEILPSQVEKFHANTAYIHSSPLSNWGAPENFNHHNMHYWGVWHGADNFNGYEKNVPRFMSEYGFQSYPMEKTMAKQLGWENLNLNDSLLLNRQKSYKTNKELIRHLKQHYPMDSAYQWFAYISQLNQSLAMQMAIDAHRRERKRCSGTLYWQLNDVWAGATWSTIDNDGKWKAAHYTVKERYKPTVLLPKYKNGVVQLTVANDDLRKKETTLLIMGMNFLGDTLFELKKAVHIPKNTSTFINEWQLENLLSKEFEKDSYFINFQLLEGKKNLDEVSLYLVEPKELNLSFDKLDLDLKVISADTVKKVILTSKVLLKDVYLELKQPGKWSKNYFDLLPNRPDTIEYISSKNMEESHQLEIMSLNQLMKLRKPERKQNTNQ